MSTNGLNQVYKHGILAIEEAVVGSNLAVGATSITCGVRVLSQSVPVFVTDGKTPYTLRDESITSSGSPNCEKIVITSNGAPSFTPASDGLGYIGNFTLTVSGFNGSAWSGGLVNAYSQANRPTILIPGVEVLPTSNDFNLRFKTLSDAPKIDFDDEASRFASGDEGRDLSIAGARSGEISFTEKLSWAGSVSAVPTWDKVMKANGHITIRRGKGTFVQPSTGNTGGTAFASLSALISHYSLSLNSYFWTDGTDTTAGDLQTAKGGSGTLSYADSFEVTQITPSDQILYVGLAGIEYINSTHSNEVTATIWIINPEDGMSPTSTVYRYRGCHGGSGSSVSAGKVGDPYMLTIKMSGAYVGTLEILASQARSLTNPTATTPEVLLNNTVTVPARVNGADTTKEVEVSQFNLDFGGVVSAFIDQSTSTGNAYFKTDDRDPKFIINPYHVRKTLDDIDNTVTNMTTGKVTVQSAPSTPHITIEIPNAQLLSPALASREGIINTNRTYRALRNNTGSGASESALYDGVMYSILIGARN